MIRFFGDAFYWIALNNKRDAEHARVKMFAETFPEIVVVTTDEVLTELLAFYSRKPSLRAGAVETVRAMLGDENVSVIAQSRRSFLDGLELYEARPDKGYSLTDCISMQTMRREGLSDVLTNDRHFEQEGFRAVFR